MKRLALLCLLLSTALLPAQSDQTAAVYQVDGLALGGYDVVSYHNGTPVRGSDAWTARHGGVKYRFTSERNQHLFRADPERYLPAYGGWCAYAMGKSGDRVEVDPETFKIVDGRLMLFYNSRWNNTLKKWNRDEAALLIKADANWKKNPNR